MSASRRPVAVVVALLAFTGALLVWVQTFGGLPGEVALGRALYHRHLPAAVRAAVLFYDAVAQPVGAVVMMPGLAALAWVWRGPRASALVVAASGVLVAVWVVKGGIGVTAPRRAVTDAHAANFPSGHVAYATAVLGAAARSLRRRSPSVSALLWTLIAGMGPTRLLGGYHVLSDVLAGYAVGCAWLIGADLALEHLRVDARLAVLQRPQARAAARSDA